VFELDGRKLHGEFHLVKTSSSEENQWLLIKANDRWASKEDVLAQDRSTLTGRRIEEYKNEIPKTNVSLPDFRTLRPMLATSAGAPFNDPEWIFELKLDGFRALALVDQENARLISRRGNDLSSDYPTLVDTLASMRLTAVLDGEIVMLDQDGVPRFELLQTYKKAREGHLVYYVFDILFYNNRDLRDQPLSERKEILQFLLSASESVRYTDHVEGLGIEFFNLVQKRGLEGIVAKKKTGPYLNGKRVDHWLKIKCRPIQEAIICGYTESRANKNELGALLVAVHQNGELKFAGRVGTGLSRAPGLITKLKKLSTRRNPLDAVPETDMPIHWVKPELVCQVEFHGWTRAGLMREPSFVSLQPEHGG
jgi:bifunctional non-homologous end joining protein LigD